MMDRLYALGISCIELVQYWFADAEGYFEQINNLSNPHYAFEVLFPMVSVLDSVFAAQLLLCMAFGSWMNTVMKWWFLEDRPYWWVKETSFYPEHQRPHLRQSYQTCETGPGCPSGHSTTIAMLLMLAVMWISHVIHDRKLNIWWWKYIVYPIFAAILTSVILARLYVATHFPHQCLLGALFGSLLAPALCIYVSDPFIWQYGCHKSLEVSRTVMWHVVSAVIAVAIAGVTYLSLQLCGFDPQWTVKLAYRWCDNPSYIHVSTTPLFALVQSTGALLGWALCVTPAVAQYRHYTKERSIFISIFSTGLTMYVFKNLQESITRDNNLLFYLFNFMISAVKPMILLRISPALSMWPFAELSQKKLPSLKNKNA